MRVRTALPLLLLGFLAPRAALAQYDLPEPGTRIRVWTENAPGDRPRFNRTAGTVSSWTDETLFVIRDGKTQSWEFPRTSVVRLETGWRRSRGRGVLRAGTTGLLIGLATGAVLGFASGDDQGGFVNFSAEDKAVILGVMLAVPSGVVGAVYGAARPGECWQEIFLPARP